MNVVEERQPNCLVTLHVEVPVDRVVREWDDVVDEFKKHASLQGYRKGSAPKKLIESRFAKEIRQELQRKLLDSSLEEAIKSKELEVISVLNVEKIELEKNRPLRFSAKVVTAPTFELPPYTGIGLEIPAPVVSEEAFTQTFESLRQGYATYEPVEGRGLEMEDLSVISYSTQLDGKPLEEVIPQAPKRLLAGKNAWIQLKPDALLPGFSDALLGMKPDETKSFELEVNAEFPIEELRGRKIAFEAILEGINKEVLPEWSDELAARILPGKTLEELKALLRQRMEDNARQTFESRKRQEVIDHLLSQVESEVPGHLVRSEMQRILREIVEENQARGIESAELRAQEHEIVGLAEKNARDRVLGSFLLLKIAEKENIQATQEDLSARILQMSQRYNITVPKLVKDLSRKNAFSAMREEILLDKALDFIVANATVREPASDKPKTASAA